MRLSRLSTELACSSTAHFLLRRSRLFFANVSKRVTIFRPHVSRTRRLPPMRATGSAHFIMCGHKIFKLRCSSSHVNSSASESSDHLHQLARFCCRKVVCLSQTTLACPVVSRSCSLAPMLGIMPCDVLHLAQARAQRASVIIFMTPAVCSPAPLAPPPRSHQAQFNPSLKTFATPMQQVLLT